jgi:membrane-bound serine protease (ClpP class)
MQVVRQRKHTRVQVLVVMIAMTIGTAFGTVTGPLSEEPAPAPSIAVINLTGMINTGTAEYLINAIQKAEEQKAACLIIELDTPGGGLEVTTDIVKRMLSARVPIVVYVSPKGARAGSAGVFITMAAHVAAMAPGTRIGAAHPVFMSMMPFGGDDSKDKEAKAKQRDYMMEKVENDTVALAVGIAKERNRNIVWAEKAVRESVSVTADVAVAQKIVDLQVDTLDQLLVKLQGRTVRLDAQTTVVLNTSNASLHRGQMTIKQRLLSFLSDPNILMILFTLGGLGLLIEFYHPGMIFPAAAGVICLVLAITSMNILPVNFGGLLLVVIGIALFIAEVYVTSYGLLGVAGAVLFVIGGIFLVDPASGSSPYYIDSGLSVSLSVIIPLALTLGLVFFYLGYYVIRAQRGKVETGIEGMIGQKGEARSEVNSGGGKVFVRGELWNALSAEPIPERSKITVLKVEGLVVHVKKLD